MEKKYWAHGGMLKTAKAIWQDLEVSLSPLSSFSSLLKLHVYLSSMQSKDVFESFLIDSQKDEANLPAVSWENLMMLDLGHGFPLPMRKSQVPFQSLRIGGAESSLQMACSTI